MLTASAHIASSARPAAEAQPFSTGNVFGWVTAGHTRRGVILCGTYGYEHHCAHRSWRELARRIALTGCTTVRFDYPGSGDSGDVDLIRLETWTDAIRRVVRFTRDIAGVEEIVLVGLRLGGTLAVLAAEGLAVDQVILLAPFATGKAYVREMSLQARMINVLPDGSPLPEQAGISAGGFALNATLLSEIKAIDLTASTRRPAADILVMGEERGGLASHYRGLGAEVATAPFGDLAQLCANAIDSEFSEPTLAVIAGHAAHGLPRGSTAHPRHFPMPAPRIDGPDWVEAPVRFGSGVVGIRCRPRSGRRRATVLFLNMGLDVHSGLGRQTTDIARRLAQAGLPSLRMDLRGAGDSPDRPDGRLPLYDTDALDDVLAALDDLTRQGAGPLIVAGTCNGAYLAFHAICRDHRIGGAVLVNLYCFDWALTHDGAPYSADAPRHLGAYLSIAAQGGAWLRLLRGRTTILKISRAVLQRLCGAVRRRLTTTSKQAAEAGRISNRIAQVRRRGAQLAFLYSDNDLGLADLHAQLGRSPSRWAQTFGRPVRIVKGADHAFSANHARDEFVTALLDISDALA